MIQHNVDIQNHDIENAFKDLEELFPDVEYNQYYQHLKNTFYESEDPQERGYIFPPVNDRQKPPEIDGKYTEITTYDYELIRGGVVYVILKKRGNK